MSALSGHGNTSGVIDDYYDDPRFQVRPPYKKGDVVEVKAGDVFELEVPARFVNENRSFSKAGELKLLQVGKPLWHPTPAGKDFDTGQLAGKYLVAYVKDLGTDCKWCIRPSAQDYFNHHRGVETTAFKMTEGSCELGARLFLEKHTGNQPRVIGQLTSEEFRKYKIPPLTPPVLELDKQVRIVPAMPLRVQDESTSGWFCRPAHPEFDAGEYVVTKVDQALEEQRTHRTNSPFGEVLPEKNGKLYTLSRELGQGNISMTRHIKLAYDERVASKLLESKQIHPADIEFV